MGKNSMLTKQQKEMINSERDVNILTGNNKAFLPFNSLASYHLIQHITGKDESTQV